MDCFIDQVLGDMTIASEWASIGFGSLALSSRFQPIVSVREERAAGYEGLLVAKDERGSIVSTSAVIDEVMDVRRSHRLDLVARALHLRNYRLLGSPGDWLFLNVSPVAALEDARSRSGFARMLDQCGVDPACIVVEILEHRVAEESLLVEAVALYKSLGCRVAIDDFGVGPTEMERVWRLHPDIVKVDGAVIRAAGRDDHAVRVLEGLVHMLQDSGARVVIEGIEERRHALIALEANADYLQGYHLARPRPSAVDAATIAMRFAELAPVCVPVAVDSSGPGSQTQARAEALEASAMAMETGASFSVAATLLLDQADMQRCYLMGADGRIIESSFRMRGAPALVRGIAVHRVGWQLQCLVREAARIPGTVLHTTPQFVPASRERSETLAFAFLRDGEVVVLCADVAA